MKYKHWLLLVIGVNATGLFSGILEPDGALYAYIAKQMAQHNDFINLYNNTDWLDKPHLPFWLTAISFKLFGFTSFAYKLPAFLLWLVSLHYLYRLGKTLYNKATAMVAVLIFATALQGVISLFDVRAEPYLTSFIIASAYYLYRLYETQNAKYVFLAALFSACAILTKGLFFLVTITSGMCLLILVRREWSQFINYRWYLYLLLTFVFIVPELYTLYAQFDLHPEKMVWGKTGVSGIRFFFWDSQFGRFLNTGPIKGRGDVLFYFHTALWAYFPWSILLYAAVIRMIRYRSLKYKATQWIVAGSAAITFLIFSVSKFQLSYYIVILFPHFSLLCADYLMNTASFKPLRFFIPLQRGLLITAWLAVVVLSLLFGLPYKVLIICVATTIAVLFLSLFRERSYSSVILNGIGFCIVVNLFLNVCFYPILLRYQSGEAAAKWLNQNKKEESDIGLFDKENFSLKWYANANVTLTDTLPAVAKDGSIVKYYFTTKQKADSLIHADAPVTVLQAFPNFHISMLTLPFLNRQTRAATLDTSVVFKIQL